MRRGAKRIDWTTADERWLRDNAGRMPLRDVCRHLKRSRSSVCNKASRLGVSVRHEEWPLSWCVECAEWRTYVSPRTGRCRVCQQRVNRDAAEARCADAMASMPPGLRAVYEDTESERGSLTRPKPPRPMRPRGKQWQRDRERVRWLTEWEAYELACATLEYDAARSRLGRMRKALKRQQESNQIGETHES